MTMRFDRRMRIADTFEAVSAPRASTLLLLASQILTERVTSLGPWHCRSRKSRLGTGEDGVGLGYELVGELREEWEFGAVYPRKGVVGVASLTTVVAEVKAARLRKERWRQELVLGHC